MNSNQSETLYVGLDFIIVAGIFLGLNACANVFLAKHCILSAFGVGFEPETFALALWNYGTHDLWAS